MFYTFFAYLQFKLQLIKSVKKLNVIFLAPAQNLVKKVGKQIFQRNKQ